MRFTRSQARAQAVEEAQAALLAIATQPYTPPFENTVISTPLLTIPEDGPLKLVVPCCLSIYNVVVPSAVTITCYLQRPKDADMAGCY
jgi:hypothetical protein